MLRVETIRTVRQACHREGKSTGQIAKDFHLSKNTMKRVFRPEKTQLQYVGKSQAKPKREDYIDWNG